jgi:hypothetical protein
MVTDIDAGDNDDDGDGEEEDEDVIGEPWSGGC